MAEAIESILATLSAILMFKALEPFIMVYTSSATSRIIIFIVALIIFLKRKEISNFIKI